MAYKHQMTTLGMLISTDPGRHDLVRRPTRQLSLQSIRAAGIRYITQSSSVVRGDTVAIDSLLEALLTKGELEQYRLFAPSTVCATLRKRIHSSWKVDVGRSQVSPTASLLTEQDPLLAIFSPSLGCGEPFRLRELMKPPLTPVISLAHGFSLHTMVYDTFLRMLLTPTYPCDTIVCTSRASKAAMESVLDNLCKDFNRTYGTQLLFEGNIDTLPLCVDTDLFQPRDRKRARSQLRLPAEAFILLFVGRISPMKADLYPLLRVCIELIADNPTKHVMLVVAGTKEEPYTTYLQSYIRGHCLEKHVRFIFDLSDDDKVSLYSAADALGAIADSVQESFGVTLIEAMACGLPQVASDWNGYRDTVAHGETGFLVPTIWANCDQDLRDSGEVLSAHADHIAIGQSIATDMGQFKRDIDILINNGELRKKMSTESRLRAETDFSYSVVAKAYEELCWSCSRIATDLTPKQRTNAFLQPRYCSTFGGHASWFIEDSSVVSPVAGDSEVQYDELIEIVEGAVSVPLGVNTALATLALQTLHAGTAQREDNTRMRGQYTFEAIARHVSKEAGVELARAKRCLMWLIKNGFAVAYRQR